MNEKKVFTNRRLLYNALLVIFASSAVLLTSYAFFNYTRTGPVNQITTGQLFFEFVDNEDINIGNAFPISQSDIDSMYESNFTLTAHTNLPDGVRYTVFAIAGDAETGKTRLLDDVMSLKFDAPANGNGFTTAINNYETAKSPVFVNGKAIISTGIVKDTEDLTTKNYKVTLWIDSDRISVSSTTKRANNAEGNPSLADATSGTLTADRFIQNDNNLVNTTLYPAFENQEGKIIYTTKEFSNSYYSLKIVVEATEIIANKELVYFDANGGTVTTDTKTVTIGSNYGTLPTPTRDGYTFLGWNGKNKFNFDLYSVLDNSVELVGGYRWKKIELDGNKTYKVGINYKNDFDGKIGTLLINKEMSPSIGWTSITHSSQPNYSLSNYQYTLVNNENLYIGYGESMTQSVLDTIVANTNVQIEEGAEATAYEPYYVTSSTTVTQEKDHVLKAIWQKNS